MILEFQDDKVAYYWTDCGEGISFNYETTFVKLGSRYFLDVLLKSIDGKLAVPQTDSTFTISLDYPRFHDIYRISVNKDTLRMEPLAYDPISELLSRQPDLLSHGEPDSDLLITATTEELREFLQSHPAADSLYIGAFRFLRSPEGTP